MLNRKCTICSTSKIFEQFEACTSFSPISTDWLCLQLTQMSRLRDLAIFVPTTTTRTTTTDRQTDCFTPCACARGNEHYIILHGWYGKKRAIVFAPLDDNPKWNPGCTCRWKNIIGASLSDPHINESALCDVRPSREIYAWYGSMDIARTILLRNLMPGYRPL